MVAAEPGNDHDADRVERVREPDGDRASKALDRAERDAARATERATRDEARYTEEKAGILERTASDPVKQQEELAKLESDRAGEIAKAQEDANEVAERLAEELEKAEEDIAKDAADRAEDAAEIGSSAELRDLADSETPEYDERGFPVRSGEIAALDLKPETLVALQAKGYSVLSEQRLQALGSTVYRLGAPEGMNSTDALAFAEGVEPGAIFDFTHYYGAQFAASGAVAKGSAAALPRKKGKLTLGMIDTEVASHPALRGVAIQKRAFGTAAGSTRAEHGTAIASILASEGASRIYAASVFRGSGAKPFTSADAIVDALEWMVANRVPVVNMSLAGPRNAILDRLITQSVGRGTLVVAAAGNGGPSAPPAYPAALRPVVAVTAVDDSGRIYRYANHGNYITVAGLGVGQPAASAGGGFSRFDGTSFATPHIAAWMARCLSRNDASSCGRSLRKSARDLGEPGYDPVYGYGLIED